MDISYKQLKSEVFLAAPTNAQLSLAVNGYDWDDIVIATWYQDGIDARWRNMVDGEERALQTAVNQAIGSGAERIRGVEVTVGVAAVLVLVMAVL